MHRSTELRHWKEVCVSCRLATETQSLPQEDQESVSCTEAMEIEQENDEWQELPSVAGSAPRMVSCSC